MTEPTSRTYWILMYEDGFEWAQGQIYPAGWRDYPFLYESEAEAQQAIATEQAVKWLQIVQGQRDFEDAPEMPSMHCVDIFEDGYISGDNFEFSPDDIRAAQAREVGC